MASDLTEPSRHKRQRVNDDTLDHGQFVKDETFWYDDGNIIVVAQSIGFRIYKGVLTAQSEFFGDLFSLPQTHNAAESNVDACPVVHVTDTPDELRSLLRALLPLAQRWFGLSCHDAGYKCSDLSLFL